MSSLPPIRFQAAPAQPSYSGIILTNNSSNSSETFTAYNNKILQNQQNQFLAKQKSRSIAQENKMKELNQRIQDLQKRYLPMMKNVYDQYDDTQKKSKELQTQSQKLIFEDISGLAKKYEELSNKFDRFMQNDLDNKTRPLQEDIKTLKNKTNQILMTTAQHVGTIGEQIDEQVKEFKSVKNKTFLFATSIESKINDLTPNLHTNERKLNEFQKILDTDQFGISYETLEAMLTETLTNLKEVDENVIPAKIEELNTEFHNEIDDIKAKNEEQLQKIVSTLNDIKDQNDQSQSQEASTTSLFEKVIDYSFLIENQLSNLESSTKTEVNVISNNYKDGVKECLETLAEISQPDEYTAAVIDTEPQNEEEEEAKDNNNNKNTEEKDNQNPENNSEENKPKKNPYVSPEMLQQEMQKRKQNQTKKPKNPYVSVEMLQQAMQKRKEERESKKMKIQPNKPIGLRTMIMNMNKNLEDEQKEKEKQKKGKYKTFDGFQMVDDDGGEHLITIPLFEHDEEKYTKQMQELRKAIEIHLIRLRKKIRGRSANNFRNQITAYYLINAIGNTISGDSNLSGHLDNIEAQIDWCINAIQIIDKERIAAQEVGCDPLNLISRISSCNQRCLELIASLEAEKQEQMEVAKPKKPKKPKQKDQPPMYLGPLVNPGLTQVLEGQKPEEEDKNEEEEEKKNEEEEEEEKNEEEQEEEEEEEEKKDKNNKEKYDKEKEDKNDEKLNEKN
ncbi:hypothetical protein TVAG_052130 [Trichomonas vaginalis G3]|uniref:Uncharacterized protein n=1 Tax=Trichomonas vaginalis (strain ATCC PRA-98 / G3) TaxID=412133 RepID=A2F4K9_TRIV3|nr:hypothetical protein TVAGG3_0047330 [Trichomonas vaginalis G3]EAY00165.1 hypothetical protein TVAG_052130 [Trichomonas vaginalis G3]KAI5541130.1 hypothetical protein TVAGG3_0047330 [Trichomonas vaginalis G3]|eukprot:XP_001313094.1 hypothetical protein [Trichomonas vaginalis G3]